MGFIAKHLRISREVRQFAGRLQWENDLLGFWACDLGSRCPMCREIRRNRAPNDLPRRG
jgi:hypothetical protein